MLGSVEWGWLVGIRPDRDSTYSKLDADCVKVHPFIKELSIEDI